MSNKKAMFLVLLAVIHSLGYASGNPEHARNTSSMSRQLESSPSGSDFSLSSSMAEKVLSGLNASGVDPGTVSELSKAIQAMTETLKEELLNAISGSGMALTRPRTGSKYKVFWWLTIFSGILGLVCFRFWSIIQRQWERSRKSLVINSMRDTDAETLHKIVGQDDLPSWINFPDFERVGWMNEIITQLWPFISVAVEGNARDLVDPLLAANKPGYVGDIKLSRLILGKQPPQVDGVKVYKQTISDIEEVVIEMDYAWAGRQECHLNVKPVPNNNLVNYSKMGLVGRLLTLKVTVDDITVNGRLRIVLKPLGHELPCIAAALVSLVGLPNFSFDMHVYGGDMSLLPGLEGFISSFIRDIVLKPFVLPERLTIPLASAFLGFGEGLMAGLKGEAVVIEETPKGLLVVELLGATDVPNADLFSKPDAFVKLSVRDKRKVKSQVKNNTYSPEFNETFELLVHEPQHQSLTAILYDYDLLSAADELGRAVLPIAGLPRGKTQEVWLEIKSPQELSHSRRRAAELVTGDSAVRTVVKKMKQSRPPCKLHLKLTYMDFKGASLRSIKSMASEDGAEPSERSASQGRLASILQGGVLYVRLRKAYGLAKTPILKGRFAGSHLKGYVLVGGMKKSTSGVQGTTEALFSDDLEFVLDGPTSQDPQQVVRVEIWDKHWKNDFKGFVEIPLAELKDAKRMKKTWPLQLSREGQVLMDLEWLTLLEAG